jgi:splicing factor 3A subunit 1
LQTQVRVQCPEIEGNEKLVGQMLEVEMASLKDNVGHLKSRLEGVVGLPANKQKLNRDGVGFLSDGLSLAHYNVTPEVVLVLSTKERGGRKK